MVDLSVDASLIGPWVFRHVHRTWGPEGRTAIGLVDGDRILAGIVFEEYTGPGGSVCLHVALGSKHIPLRRLLAAAATYCFHHLAVEKVIGQVPSYNVEALTFDLKLGFRAEAIIKGVYADGDLVIVSMTRDECKFLPKQKMAA